MGIRIAQGVMTDVSDYLSLTTGYLVSKLVASSYFVGKRINEPGFVRDESLHELHYELNNSANRVKLPNHKGHINVGEQTLERFTKSN